MSGQRWTEDDLRRLQERRRPSVVVERDAHGLPARLSLGRRGVGPVDPFLLLLEAHGLPAPLREFCFLPGRRFRADYAWLAPWKLIVEREGGIWSTGPAHRAHAQPSNILRDMRRSNLAQLAGFLYLRFLPEELDTGTCLPTLRILLGNECPTGRV